MGDDTFLEQGEKRGHGKGGQSANALMHRHNGYKRDVKNKLPFVNEFASQVVQELGHILYGSGAFPFHDKRSLKLLAADEGQAFEERNAAAD